MHPQRSVDHARALSLPARSNASTRETVTPWWLIAPLALAPIFLAVLQLGRWHPDEVYQFLEPAYFRVHGYGIRAWEWNVGLRNWATPLLYAGLLQVSNALGIEHPHLYRALIALPQLALNLGAIWAVWRYLERRLSKLGGGWLVLAVLSVAAFAPMIVFGGRTMGESLSTSLLLLAAERLDRDPSAREPHARDATRADGLWAGLWLGLSVVVRYGSAVFVISALVWLLATRRFRSLLWTCLSGGVVALVLGGLDWATWGKPFHSLFAYTEFNVVSGDAAERFGASEWYWYLPLLLAWIPLWAWAGAVASTVKERRLPWPALAGLVYVASISATGHKEERFLYPGVVLLVLAAAPGWIWLVTRVRSPFFRVAVAVLTLAAGLVPLVRVPDFRGDQFRAQIIATRDDGARGLLIIGDGLWGSGGHFYMGRNIPLYNADDVTSIRHFLTVDRRVNRVIAIDDRAVKTLESFDFVPAGQVGRVKIWVRRESGGPQDRERESNAPSRTATEAG